MKIGDIIVGKVTGIEKYGIFISCDNGYSGLIHISEISDSFVRNVNDYVELDEIIKAKIIGIASDEKKLKLSIKNFQYRDVARYSNGIIETKNGFSSLKNMLDIWILDKKNVIEEKK